MAHWTLEHQASGHGSRSFRRPLGPSEQCLYNDSIVNGGTDCVQFIAFELLDHVFSEENAQQIWLEMKSRFPLLGARVEEHDELEAVDFVVEEQRLALISNGELEIVDVKSEKEARDLFHDVLSGPRRLNSDQLANVIVMRRTDQRQMYHLVVNIAHCVTDYWSNATVSRTFLDLLSRTEHRLDVIKQDLAVSLARLVCWESQCVPKGRSRAVTRWRLVIARVMNDLAITKLRGGNTLPRVPSTSYRGPYTKSASVSIPDALVLRILATCRRQRKTFGHAFPVLAQVALARVLYRRHLRGDISGAEVAERLKTAMHNTGLVDLRTTLERTGAPLAGEGERIFCCYGYMIATLPFLPHPSAAAAPPTLDATGAPIFSSLLSRGRFFLRCEIMKRQMVRFQRHPLFLEVIAGMRGAPEIAKSRALALQWRAHGRVRLPSSEVTFTHGGSSIGNIDHIFPLVHPTRTPPPTIGSKVSSPPPHRERPVLLVRAAEVGIRARPAYLYLGARTSLGTMILDVYFDGNMYDGATVREWLHEIRNAALWYLADAAEDGSRNGARL